MQSQCWGNHDKSNLWVSTQQNWDWISNCNNLFVPTKQRVHAGILHDHLDAGFHYTVLHYQVVSPSSAAGLIDSANLFFLSAMGGVTVKLWSEVVSNAASAPWVWKAIGSLNFKLQDCIPAQCICMINPHGNSAMVLCSSRVRDTHTHLKGTHWQKHMHTYISAVHQPDIQFYTIRHMSLHICSPCPHCLQCKFWIATHGISILGFIWCIFLQQCFFLLLHDHALNILPARTCCNMLQHQPKGYPILVIIVPLLRSWLRRVFVEVIRLPMKGPSFPYYS